MRDIPRRLPLSTLHTPLPQIGRIKQWYGHALQYPRKVAKIIRKGCVLKHGISVAVGKKIKSHGSDSVRIFGEAASSAIVRSR